MAGPPSLYGWPFLCTSVTPPCSVALPFPLLSAPRMPSLHIIPTAYNLTVTSLMLKKTKLKNPLWTPPSHLDPAPFPLSPSQQHVVNGFPLTSSLPTLLKAHSAGLWCSLPQQNRASLGPDWTDVVPLLGDSLGACQTNPKMSS